MKKTIQKIANDIKNIIIIILLIVMLFVAFGFAVAPFIIAFLTQNWLALLLYLGYPIISYIFFVFWYIIFVGLIALMD